MTDPDLVRFINAQASVYEQVVEELSEGRKRTHWMWFIFPQLSGLVSVREHIESDESFVIQERRPDSGGAAADVDDRKPCSL